MDSKKCFFQSCHQKVIYYCRCTPAETFTCSRHWEAHTQQWAATTHACKRIYDNKSEETKLKILNFLNKEKSDLDMLKADIIRQNSANLAKMEINLDKCLNEVEFKSEYIKKAMSTILNAKEISPREKDPFLIALSLNPEDGIDACKQLLGDTKSTFDTIYKYVYAYDERLEQIAKNMIKNEIKHYEKKCLKLTEEKVKEITNQFYEGILSGYEQRVIEIKNYCNALEQKVRENQGSILTANKSIIDAQNSIKNYEFLIKEISERNEYFGSPEFRRKIKEETLEAIRTERNIKFVRSIHCIDRNCDNKQLGAYYSLCRRGPENKITYTNEKIYWSCSLHASGKNERVEDNCVNTTQFADFPR